MISNTHLQQRLRTAGLRATPQRLLLMQILEGTEEHLDAEALYEQARQQDPRISLATVYRTLSALKEAGLVDQRYFAREHRREYFEAAQPEEHYHFTCLGCGRVIEFSTPLMEQVRRDLEARFGVRFNHACVCFEGFCPECAGTS